jgi:hypothetical protein
MRLIFGTILALLGILATMTLSRLLVRAPRDTGAEGGLTWIFTVGEFG